MTQIDKALVERAVRAHFEERAFGALDVLLSDDVVLKPPTYWKAWRGRDAVVRLLGFAASNIDRLTYRRIFWEDRHAAFQFDAEIGEVPFSGVDFFSFAASGLITEIEIVARPPRAIALLSDRMGASVAADPFFARR